MTWIETLGVLLLAFAGVVFGKWFSKKSYWILGFVIPFFFLALIGITRYFPGLEFFPPVSWMMAGRTEFAAMAIITAMLLVTPVSRTGLKRLNILAHILLACVIIYYSVLPFLIPGIIKKYLLNLKTTLDKNNVCLQSNGYNCGPSAAVTALRQLGVKAEEGQLAVLSHTNPIAGTPPDSLCLAIRKHDSNKKVGCEYRKFNSISELQGREPVVALVKYSFLVDHYVTVLAINDKTVTLGDPLVGLRQLSRTDFQKMWRYRGIVLRSAKRTSSASRAPAATQQQN
jgi:predicted double-glycine peptidase